MNFGPSFTVSVRFEFLNIFAVLNGNIIEISAKKIKAFILFCCEFINISDIGGLTKRFTDYLRQPDKNLVDSGRLRFRAIEFLDGIVDAGLEP